MAAANSGVVLGTIKTTVGCLGQAAGFCFITKTRYSSTFFYIAWANDLF